MAADYATIPELKAALSMSGESFADPEVALAITAASRAIDNITRRRFDKDSDVNQIRFYSPRAPLLIGIDDLVDLTALATDPGGEGIFGVTWTLNTDFVFEPLNAQADGKPWDLVRVHPGGANTLPSCYPRSVRVTGRFGWPAVPTAVKEATLMLAGRLLKRVREAPFGVVSVGMDEVAAAHIARVDPDIQLLVGPYVRLF